MAKFVTVGERIHCISPVIREAMATKNPAPILQRAKEQIDAGATYLDVNIGPAESTGVELMKWAVTTIQSSFDNVPLCLDTSNKAAIEAGISVYNRSKGKPIVNSADAGDRIEVHRSCCSERCYLLRTLLQGRRSLRQRRAQWLIARRCSSAECHSAWTPRTSGSTTAVPCHQGHAG